MSVAEYFSTNNVQQCSTLSVGPSNVLALLTGDAQIYSLGWYKLEELKSSEGGINLANSAISMPTNTRSKINSNMSKRCIEKVQATFVPLQQVISQRSTKWNTLLRHLASFGPQPHLLHNRELFRIKICSWWCSSCSVCSWLCGPKEYKSQRTREQLDDYTKKSPSRSWTARPPQHICDMAIVAIQGHTKN